MFPITGPADEPVRHHGLARFVNECATLLLGRLCPASGPWGPIRERVSFYAQASPVGNDQFRRRLIRAGETGDQQELLKCLNECYKHDPVDFSFPMYYGVELGVVKDFTGKGMNALPVFHMVVPPADSYGASLDGIEDVEKYTSGWC